MEPDPEPEETPDKFAKIRSSIEFHHDHLLGILAHHPTIRPLDNDPNGTVSGNSILGRRELNQANANASHRHIGWSDQTQNHSSVSPSEAELYVPLLPSPSDRILAHFGSMSTTDRSGLPPPASINQDEQKKPLINTEKCEEISEVFRANSHESINLALLKSLPTPPGSPPSTFTNDEITRTPRNFFDQEDPMFRSSGQSERVTELGTGLYSTLPSIHTLPEEAPNPEGATHTLKSGNVSVNPLALTAALTTVYEYKNSAYAKTNKEDSKGQNPTGTELEPNELKKKESYTISGTFGYKITRTPYELILERQHPPPTETKGTSPGENDVGTEMCDNVYCTPVPVCGDDCETRNGEPSPPTSNHTIPNYDTDDELWEPAKPQVLTIQLANLPTPDAAFMTLYLSPQYHPHLSKVCKKDCRTWLWKGERGRKARRALREADNKSRGISQDSILNQSTHENANCIITSPPAAVTDRGNQDSQRFL